MFENGRRNLSTCSNTNKEVLPIILHTHTMTSSDHEVELLVSQIMIPTGYVAEEDVSTNLATTSEPRNSTQIY